VQLLENIPLAHSPPRIGGPARYFVEAKGVAEVQESGHLRAPRAICLSLFLAARSNLVVADAGWPGLVLKIAVEGIDQRPGHDEDGNVYLRHWRRRSLG